MEIGDVRSWIYFPKPFHRARCPVLTTSSDPIHFPSFAAAFFSSLSCIGYYYCFITARPGKHREIDFILGGL